MYFILQRISFSKYAKYYFSRQFPVGSFCLSLLKTPHNLSYQIYQIRWKCTTRSPVVDFASILQAAFTGADPKSTKKTDNLTEFLALLGSAHIKAANKTLIKLTPVVNFTNIYVQIFCQYSFIKKLQSQTVIREKLQEALLYEKGICKMLMKLTPAVNFINI
jgi:hypothetical protein